MSFDKELNQYSRSRSRNTNSEIPKWAVYSICFIFTIVTIGLIKSILPLIAIGAFAALIFLQATKPPLDLEEEPIDTGKQLSLFHRKYRIGRKYSKLKEQEEQERNAA